MQDCFQLRPGYPQPGPSTPLSLLSCPPALPTPSLSTSLSSGYVQGGLPLAGVSPATCLAATNSAPTARRELSAWQNVYGTYPQENLTWHLAVLNHQEGSPKTTCFCFCTFSKKHSQKQRQMTLFLEKKENHTKPPATLGNYRG